MTLEDMLKTLRTAQYERVEIRDDSGNEILTCPAISEFMLEKRIHRMRNKEAIRWLLQIKDKYIHGGDDSFDASRREAIDRAVNGLAFIEDNCPKTFEDYLNGEEI